MILYWAALANCAALVVALTSIFVPTPLVILRLAAWAVHVASVLHVAGWLLCLSVPRESRAKGLIVTAVILQLIAVVIGFTPRAAGLPRALDAVLALADLLVWLAAVVVFLLFLKRLGRYLNRPEVSEEAQSLMYGVLGLVAFVVMMAALGAYLGHTIADSGGVAARPGLFTLSGLLRFATCVAMIGAAIYLLIRYLRLLESLHHGVVRAGEL
jgi:hypothetical protein